MTCKLGGGAAVNGQILKAVKKHVTLAAFPPSGHDSRKKWRIYVGDLSSAELM